MFDLAESKELLIVSNINLFLSRLFQPAKNKKYPHFTHARDKDVFNGRKCSHMKVVHKPADKGSTFSRGSSVDSQTSESSATSSRSTG
jgi:hypothetical protein